MGADMGVRGTGDGPKVMEYKVKTREDAAQVLASEIERFMEHGGLSASEITILSRRPFAESGL